MNSSTVVLAGEDKWEQHILLVSVCLMRTWEESHDSSLAVTSSGLGTWSTRLGGDLTCLVASRLSSSTMTTRTTSSLKSVSTHDEDRKYPAASRLEAHALVSRLVTEKNLKEVFPWIAVPGGDGFTCRPLDNPSRIRARIVSLNLKATSPRSTCRPNSSSHLPFGSTFLHRQQRTGPSDEDEFRAEVFVSSYLLFLKVCQILRATDGFNQITKIKSKATYIELKMYGAVGKQVARSWRTWVSTLHLGVASEKPHAAQYIWHVRSWRGF